MERDFNYRKRVYEKRVQDPFISQTNLTYTLLLEDILVFHNRAPGSKINQDQLSVLLGVSRSPVRDAIDHLIADGLLIRQSRNGYYVYIPTMRDATHIVEFRTAIEVAAGRLATKRATAQDMERIRENVEKLEGCDPPDLDKMIALDIEFHDLIVASSKNEFLIRAYHQQALMLRYIRTFTMTGTATMRDKTAFRHRYILEALVNRNSEQMESALQIHLQNNLEDYIEAEKYTYR